MIILLFLMSFIPIISADELTLRMNKIPRSLQYSTTPWQEVDLASDDADYDSEQQEGITRRPSDGYTGQPLPPDFENFAADKQKDDMPFRPSVYTSDEYRLYSHLLLKSNYSKHVRPVRDHLDPVVVKG